MSDTLLEELVGGRAPPLVPLTIDQLHEMIDAGIVPNGAPIELIDGILVYKDRGSAGDEPMTHNPRHAGIVRRLNQQLSKWCESELTGCFVQSQLPVALSKTSAPEPDVAIIFGNEETFATRHPGPSDIAAVFEIADSSLRYDRTTKQRLYASAGVPAYWIINRAENRVEVYLRPGPSGGSYLDRTEYRPGQSITLTVGKHVLEIDVKVLLA
jgi:Uma2 family endonuclease